MSLAKYRDVFIATVFLAGVVFWGGFNWAMEATNTESFCISCHEMRNNVYAEYRDSVHYSNPTGVRATCPDCHVPREWTHKLFRKISATAELYHKLRGTIDTREKFLARRPHLARKVWEGMLASDSRECRNCHAFDSMNLEQQSPKARTMHRLSIKWGKTCIDCHRGIAHHLPESYDAEAEIDRQHELLEREGIACITCHEDMPRPPADDDWD